MAGQITAPFLTVKAAGGIFRRFHVGEDVGQDLLGIVVGISEDAFRSEGQRLSSLAEKRHRLLLFIVIRREGSFMKREFRDGIV